MTTIDTDALTERIARALWEDDLARFRAAHAWGEEPEADDWYRDQARAVLPIVAEEAEARADYWRTEARTQRHRADDQEDRAIRAVGNLDAAQARAATAEARLQAVRDVLAQHPYGGPDQEDAVRRALEG